MLSSVRLFKILSIRTVELDWAKREVMEVCAANGIAVEKRSIKPKQESMGNGSVPNLIDQSSNNLN